MSYSSRITIFSSELFDIVSYGNGYSYAFHNNKEKKSLFMQGEDAETFRNDIEAWENIDENMTYDDIYSIMWDELT
jgi:hypothetical protein